MADNPRPSFARTNSMVSSDDMERHFYPTHVAMPDLPPYGVGYSHFYMPSGMQSNIVSEQYYDRQDCITPLSQHSFVEHNTGASDTCGPTLIHTSLDLPTGLVTGSPGTFMTPNWTPEPMAQFEEHHGPLSTPVASPRSRHQYSSSNTSAITIAAQSARVFTPIAPNPSSKIHRHSLKRSASRDEDVQATPGPKRKRSTSPSSPNNELNIEDELLLRLKDEEGLTWKEIQARFQSDLNKMFQIPALQMRLKRLRERMREWTETDVKALRLAHEYWNDNKFDIISAKMVEFGANEKWSAKQCYKKWNEVAPQPEFFQPPHFQTTPTFTPIPYSVGFVNGPAEHAQPFVTTSA